MSDKFSKSDLRDARGCLSIIILIVGGAVLGGWTGVGIGILIYAVYLWIGVYLKGRK